MTSDRCVHDDWSFSTRHVTRLTTNRPAARRAMYIPRILSPTIFYRMKAPRGLRDEKRFFPDDLEEVVQGQIL